VLGEQGVEPLDHGDLVAGAGRLEHRTQLLDEPAHGGGVLGGDRAVQPLATIEEGHELVGVEGIGVHEGGGPLRVPDEVHPGILRSTAREKPTKSPQVGGLDADLEEWTTVTGRHTTGGPRG
jgi:hypothetical protein